MINNWDGYSMGRNNYRMFHDLSRQVRIQGPAPR
jgi:hypothetical protein